MIPNARVIILIVLAFLLLQSKSVPAQEYNALAQCRAQSTEPDSVHACMDLYLDAMDASIDSMAEFLARSLSGEALNGLGRSQLAFEEYRRQNCLWYLEFSSQREEADQIAKNCLADMSRNRLEELRRLVSNDADAGQIMVGYYAFGAESNSFQPCGRQERYWVEGTPDTVGLLQQNYLSVATTDRQLLHVTLTGRIDTQAQAPEEHQGVLQLSSLIEVRVPTDTDCSLSSEALSLAPVSVNDVTTPELVVNVADEDVVDPDEPRQQLTAYFGEWVVDCVEVSTGRKSCALQVALSQVGEGAQNAEGIGSVPSLVLNRTPELSTDIELKFPGREIESPALIHWQIDATELGDIVGSEVRVDQLGARQLVEESPYLIEEVLPMMMGGEELGVSVLESVDNRNGDSYVATLIGLTKAMQFADGFVRDEG